MLNLKEIEKAVSGKILSGSEYIIPTNYVIDSREIAKGDFYVPIVGNKVNGHDYILDCVKKGAMGYFISNDYINKDNIIQESIKLNKDICIVAVEDTQKALYDAGKYNRYKHSNIPIIAVTGSVGKTSTRQMIASILSQEKEVLVTQKNYNSYIGVSIMLLKLYNQDICVLETGVDRVGDMIPLSEAIKPDIAVITNIGTAHIEFFKSRENILKEKLQITDNLTGNKTLIVNSDNDLLDNLKETSKYSVEKVSINNVDDIKEYTDKIEFKTNIYNEETEVLLNTIGTHNIYNTLIAIKVAEIIGIQRDNILKGISSYNNFSRRFEIKKQKNDVILIDDTYNASIDSMRAGIDTLSKMKAKRKIAVLGDMLELGEFSDSLHEEVGESFNKKDIDILFTLGKRAENIAKSAKKYVKIVKSFDNFDELEKELINIMSLEDVIYFKASNLMKFNKLINDIEDYVG